jgi:hypothetical protein
LGHDTLLGGAGNDTLVAGPNGTTIYGGAGDDTCLGGIGADVMFGGDGNDFLDGSAGNDYLDGGIGNDTLNGDADNDTIFGDIGDDTLHGGMGADQIYGGQGNDTLYGDDGNDQLDGGTDTNEMFGGSGADQFYSVPVPKSAQARGTVLLANDMSTGDGDSSSASYDPNAGWFDATLTDVGLRSLARFDYQDGSLTRSDMLGLYSQIETDEKVTGDELKDLRTVCNTKTGLEMPDDVSCLTNEVIGNSWADSHFGGHPLHPLKNGVSSDQLSLRVNKWFLGEDLPKADPHTNYQSVGDKLFLDGPSYVDVRQGAAGDCYLLSSLAELAVKAPNAIENMFLDNGDGTFGVRFYKNGVAKYVTVNDLLPVYYSSPVYANFHPNSYGDSELWVALVEKAYCQVSEEGWTHHGHTNSYKGISGGSPVEVIAEITGQATDFTPIKANSPSSMLSSIVGAFDDGKTITMATKNHGTAKNVVNNHSYAMIGYDAATQKVTLFNPWGINNGSEFPGLITIAWSDVVRSFCEWETETV